jgi:NitT/TauT family transport system ATP-binding protein
MSATAAPSARPDTGTSGDARGAVPAIEVGNVYKSFGPWGDQVVALMDMSLTVRRGEFVCLLGASGCGKSTLLNLLARLDRSDAGWIRTDGRVSLLFQEAALFPWLTAGDNIDLALRLAGVPSHKRRAEVDRLLDLVQLSEFGAKRPHQLSGGMRQRTALARALAQSAEILLMDEPFGSLDAMTRDALHDELERLWIDSGFTVLFVTHNVREAVRLGDRVAVLSSRPGRVVEEFPIDLPRPRRMSDPRVGALAGTITDRLREEVERHAAD